MRAWISFGLLWIVSTSIMGGARARAAEDPPRRPNFLFVYTDDQRWDAFGAVQREQGDRARFPWFRTPSMDRLAAEGFRFRNAFVVLSLCAPSRAAFMTGRYNHLNGIANNHTPFSAETETYATLLRFRGYRTGYVGKWHMGSQSGKRPGFDYSASFIGQGRYNDCPFEIDGKVTATQGWVDDRSTDFAIEFIERNQAGPFALIVGMKSTHGPWDPPDRAAGRFKGEKARPVPNLTVSAIYRGANRPPEPAKAKKAAGKKAAGPALRNPPEPGENAAAGVNLNYFRCVSAADDNLGRLLDTLDRLKLAEDTVVVFTSDNGFYLGEHGLGDKRTAYDESLRIPFILRYPRLKAKGVALDAMALNIDVAPTFLDLAGAAVPATMQGKSLKPLLETGKAPADWRKSYFYEYFREQGFAAPTTLAARTEDAKIVKYPGHDEWTEVFDLRADPYETRNLANDPAHAALRKRMEEEFTRASTAVEYRLPPYADEAKPGAP